MSLDCLEDVKESLGVESVELTEKEKEWLEKNKEKIREDTTEYIQLQNGGSKRFPIDEILEEVSE